MKNLSLPSYTELQAILNQSEQSLQPSEIHGLLVGLLTGSKTPEAAWNIFLSSEHTSYADHAFVKQLFEESNTKLSDFLFEFTLFLPDDDEPLPSRAEALTCWCQWFLTGLTLSGKNIHEIDQEEAQEAILDLLEIAKMNYDVVVDNEEDEVAYTELVEYVRMAVIIIYQQFL